MKQDMWDSFRDMFYNIQMLCAWIVVASERLMLSTFYFHHMMPHHLSMDESNIVS